MTRVKTKTLRYEVSEGGPSAKHDVAVTWQIIRVDVLQNRQIFGPAYVNKTMANRVVGMLNHGILEEVWNVG